MQVSYAGWMVSPTGSTPSPGYTRAGSGPIRRRRLDLRRSCYVRSIGRCQDTLEVLPLTSSIGAMLRISLRRSRADWPIVFAAALICLLASTLLAAGSIYASAVSTAGLHRVLEAAPPADANVAVSYRTEPGAAAVADATIREALQDMLGSTGGQILRLGRSDSFALPGQADVRELVVLGFADGITEHATLVSGSWPEPGAGSGSAIPVAVPSALGLATGDLVSLESRAQAGFLVPVEVVAVYRVDDRSSGFWWGDPLATDGVVTSERFVTYGPLYMTEADLLARAVPVRVELEWRALPDVAALSVGDMSGLSVRVGALGERLRAALGTDVSVHTGLPEILATAGQSLLVSRTGVLLLTIQLVVLAAYAVLLAAALLVEHRRVDTAMLRSRGAGRYRIVGLAFAEAVLLTIPAALIAPWLAAVALRAFNVAGPLAAIDLPIDPAVTLDAYVAAGVAALVCLVALTVPAIRTERSLSGVQGREARGERTSLGQRLGLDIALLAVTGVGLWQLRHYGAPLTRSVQGTLGLDPLLVATPAIGLLAGAIVALRIVPLLAQLAEGVTIRARGLVPSLGARQLARRPLRYTRAALLLMLAMAMGVFAVCYTWTWTASQQDQATFQVGADLRVAPGSRHDALPDWALDQAYAALPGVIARLPVEREPVRVSRASRSGQIVAMDAAVAPGVASLRPDLTEASLAELLRPLEDARPEVAALALPGEPRELRISLDLEIRAVERQELDGDTGEVTWVPAELGDVDGFDGLAVSAVVRDGRGLLHRFAGKTGEIGGGAHQLVVPLAGAAGPDAAFAGPLELFALEVSMTLPERYRTRDATLTVGGLAAAGADGIWQAVPLELPFGWRSTAAFYGRPHQAVAAGIRDPGLETQVGGPGFAILPGADQFGRGTVLTFAPDSLSRVGSEPIPVVASQPFLDATGGTVGGEQSLTVYGVPRTIVVTGSLRALPGTDPDEPTVLMDLATLSLLRFEGNDAVEPVEEWWLAVDDGSRDATAAALAGPPFDSDSVLSTFERERLLATDPVALGIIGALAIGFVAAGLFAVVGFIVSAAVSARERITEFALLRALGLSAGQLSVWLSLENTALAFVSLGTGSLLGLVIAWVVLPFITVTQGAATPFPPVLVAVPWTAIAGLVAVALVALAASVLVLTWLLRRIGLASVIRMSED
jgi:hypothetical protein